MDFESDQCYYIVVMFASRGAIADIDLEACVRAKISHDLAGHYNRADVFNVRVNRTAPLLYQPYVTSTEEEARISAASRNAVGDVPGFVSHATQPTTLI